MAGGCVAVALPMTDPAGAGILMIMNANIFVVY